MFKQTHYLGNPELYDPTDTCEPTSQATVRRLTADSWPTVGQLTADSRPTVGQLTADSRQTVLQVVSPDSRPTHVGGIIKFRITHYLYLNIS